MDRNKFLQVYLMNGSKVYMLCSLMQMFVLKFELRKTLRGSVDINK